MKIKYIEVDRSLPVDSVTADPDYDTIIILVMWRYTPLGELKFIYQPGCVLSSDIILNEAYERFGELLYVKGITGSLDWDKKGEKLPPVSVIICTRERAQLLERCLRSLKELDYSDYEIIVVDNCSNDPEVKTIAERYSAVYRREDRPGLDNARNAGIKAASFDIVAFIDDDASAGKGWLRGIARSFMDPEIMAVTGLVVPQSLETMAQIQFERFGGMGKGFQPFTISRISQNQKELFFSSGWGVGANMAFRKEIFSAIGEFNPALDAGTPAAGGSDIEFFFRVVHNGYRLRYEPSAMVKHLHRNDMQSLKNERKYNMTGSKLRGIQYL
ncbi:MAG: glycosyltransferase [Syntrophothermus sp.]